MLFYQHSRPGPGPLTLYLHGFLGSGNNLGSLARLLAQDTRYQNFALVDLLGHGKSPRLAPGATLVDQAAAVLDVAATLSDAPVRLVGHSLGGRVALCALGRATSNISEVVLLDIGPSAVTRLDDALSLALASFLAAPERVASRAQMRAHFLNDNISEGLADWLLMGLVPSEGQYVWRVDRAALASFRNTALETDLWPEITRWFERGSQRPRLRCLRGGGSQYVSDDAYARMAALQVETHTLENAGHFVHVDAPKRIHHILTARPNDVGLIADPGELSR